MTLHASDREEHTGDNHEAFLQRSRICGPVHQPQWEGYCATTLFNENIDEQLIKRQTGHKSDAVRAYKRPCSSHDVAVSDALQPPSAKQLVTNLESEAAVSVPLKTKAGGMPVFNFDISFNMKED